MPRKVTTSLQRKVSPDRKYQSILIQRLINKSMLDGKKQTAERAVYLAIEGAAKKLNSENPVEIFEQALSNISPNFEVKSRRVGGANYQIPLPPNALRLQLASPVCSRSLWYAFCKTPRARNCRCLQRNRCRLQEKRRHSPYGRSKPCLRTLCSRLEVKPKSKRKHLTICGVFFVVSIPRQKIHIFLDNPPTISI